MPGVHPVPRMTVLEPVVLVSTNLDNEIGSAQDSLCVPDCSFNRKYSIERGMPLISRIKVS